MAFTSCVAVWALVSLGWTTGHPYRGDVRVFCGEWSAVCRLCRFHQVLSFLMARFHVHFGQR